MNGWVNPASFMRKREEGFLVIKRILIALCVFIVMFLLGSALVGADVILPTVGALIWLLGIVGAVIAFIRTKPKAN